MSSENIIRPPVARSFTPGFAAVIRAELDYILASPQIQQSPTLARLLAWLVEQTLAGRGDALKSYTVAVEGMGRPENFDSQADSYPRVQVGRLRKALESHYAHHAPRAEQCIYIHPGSYRVKLGRLDQAYPTLYRSSPPALPVAVPETGTTAPTAIPAPATQLPELILHESNRRWLLALLIVTLVAITLWYFSVGQQSNSGSNASISESESPVLLLAAVRGAENKDSAELANSAYALMADGFSRSWVARVRLGDGNATAADQGQKPAYRIETQIGSNTAEGKVFFVRLSDERTSTVIWSNSVVVRGDTPVSESIAPIISQISGPFGAIARNETLRINGNYRPGYSCLLGYLAYLNSRNENLRKSIGTCLNVPVHALRLEAVRHSFLAFLALDRARAGLKEEPSNQSALTLARKATVIEPKEAYGQFAMARAYFINGDCVSGRRHTQLAFEANRYDPIILAILGNFSSDCGFKEADAMLGLAYRYRVEGESYARLSLILSAIRQKDLSRLPMLREPGRDVERIDQPYHFLCETLIAAALNETNIARQHWSSFVAVSGDSKETPDELIRPVILAKDVRAKVVRFLAEREIFQ